MEIKLFIGFFLILCGFLMFVVLFKYFISEYKNRNIITPDDFDTVYGKIVDSEVGIKHLSSEYGDKIRYYPWIKYSYTYKDINYINDRLTYPYFYEILYKNNIKAKKILDSHQNNTKIKVLVLRSDPDVSCIQINKYGLEKQDIKTTDGIVLFYLLLMFIPFNPIFIGLKLFDAFGY